MLKNDWPYGASEFRNYLKENYGLMISIRGINSEFIVNGIFKEGIHYVNVGTRKYGNRAAELFARIQFLNKYLGYEKKMILEENLHENNAKLLESLSRNKGSNLLLTELCRMIESHQSRIEEIDWKAIWKLCNEFKEEEYDFKIMYEQAIEKLDVDELREKLYDELKDTEWDTFADEHDLEYLDESDAPAEIRHDFLVQLYGKIEEDLFEECRNWVESHIRQDLKDMQQEVRRIPSMALHHEYLSFKINKLLRENLDANKISRQIDRKLGDLDFLDKELLSVLFLNICSDWALNACLGWHPVVSHLQVDGLELVFTEYVEMHFEKIKDCSEYLEKLMHDYKQEADEVYTSNFISLQYALTCTSIFPKGIESVKEIAYSLFHLPQPL